MALRYGILGCGHLGCFHAEKVASLDSTELVGVFDIDKDKTKATADKYGCTPFENIDDLLAVVDAVSIVVPTEQHYEVGLRALDAGKHLLIEKPITTTVEQAEELTKISDSKGLLLQVGHIERFNPTYQALKLLPEAPRFIEGHRLSQFNPRGLDVAVILDLMIHDIDLILSMIDSEVSEIHASAVAVISDKPDIANARIEFANGSIANLTASRISTNKMRKLRLFAKDNYLSIDMLQKKGEHFLLADKGAANIPDGYFSAFQYEPTGKQIYFGSLKYQDVDMLALEIDSFANAVLNNTKVKVNAHDATRALRVAKEIEKIANEHLNRFLT